MRFYKVHLQHTRFRLVPPSAVVEEAQTHGSLNMSTEIAIDDSEHVVQAMTEEVYSVIYEFECFFKLLFFSKLKKHDLPRFN